MPLRQRRDRYPTAAGGDGGLWCAAPRFWSLRRWGFPRHRCCPWWLPAARTRCSVSSRPARYTDSSSPNRLPWTGWNRSATAHSPVWWDGRTGLSRSRAETPGWWPDHSPSGCDTRSIPRWNSPGCRWCARRARAVTDLAVPRQSAPPGLAPSGECDSRIGAAAVGDPPVRRSLLPGSVHTSGRTCCAGCPTRPASALRAATILPRYG